MERTGIGTRTNTQNVPHTFSKRAIGWLNGYTYGRRAGRDDERADMSQKIKVDQKEKDRRKVKKLFALNCVRSTWRKNEYFSLFSGEAFCFFLLPFSSLCFNFILLMVGYCRLVFFIFFAIFFGPVIVIVLKWFIRAHK